ncbi:gnt1 alphan-acetylglucosamine transferase [Trichoderma arundinaceum]|uniref:Gnt1 alphan-acetylglucosamine transferase n=1 Tax=Trichoderma arundinaceum TaxID=490622 RepID=A0A395NUP4_TRIAR|nr:gnt1 alphan-acetylglucosamine transferase [Trichoderma arundinaceum]
MTVRLEKITAHYAALLSTRRGRILIALTTTIISIFVFLNRTKDYGQEPVTFAHTSSVKETDTDWSRFAYTQYVTHSEYLCTAVMLLERLYHLRSRADRVLMYPAKMLPDPNDFDGGGFHDGELLVKARDEYGVKLVPIEVQHKDTVDDTWANSYTKLLAFNQTQYERVITIDSDTTLLKHMDELFHLPPCPIAMPRAYWLQGNETCRMTLASHVMVIQPSEQEFGRIQKRIQLAGEDEYDMELLNKIYMDTAMVLPHRPYTMISSEFRKTDHHLYLGSDTEEWDPLAMLSEVKTIHFSDYPVPKPWKKHLTMDDQENMIKMEPKCEMKKKKDNDGDDKEDCSGRDIWRELYADFRERKATICAKKVWRKFEDVKFETPKSTDPEGIIPIPHVEQDDDMPIFLSR